MAIYARRLLLLVFTVTSWCCVHCEKRQADELEDLWPVVGTSSDGGEPPFPGQWKVVEILTDEFEGETLNRTKWLPYNPAWKGRMPGLFVPSNVRVTNGTLQLTSRVQNVSGEPAGFGNFTTAAVQSSVFQRYGYFEVRVKAMNSRASSSFWFSTSETHDYSRTEIDVFELCGGKQCMNQTSRYNMNIHSFRHTKPECNGTKTSLRNHSDVVVPFLFSDDFHVMALLWEEDYIVWTLDGRVVRNATNLCFDQGLKLDFDSETMPYYMGLPDPDNLPSTYYVDYVRTWEHPNSYQEKRGPHARRHRQKAAHGGRHGNKDGDIQGVPSWEAGS